MSVSHFDSVDMFGRPVPSEYNARVGHIVPRVLARLVVDQPVDTLNLGRPRIDRSNRNSSASQ